MTNIQEQLKEIYKKSRTDFETAHRLEKKLYISVLDDIANNRSTDPVKHAQEALEARKIEFDRYFA